MIYIAYLDLSPGLKNQFSILTHKVIIESLRNFFENNKNFFEIHPEYDLGFTIVTKREIPTLEVRGPTVIKKTKDIDYSIFLPNETFDVQKYIDYVFEGISIAMSNYNIDKSQILALRDKCKEKFG